MKNISKLFFIIFFIICMFVGAFSLAADTAIVDATITVQNISISISGDKSISYGPMAPNTSKTTIDFSETQTISNTGNVVEDINIKGFNTACPWILSSSTGDDYYVHKFCQSTDFSCSSPPTNYNYLSTSYKRLYSNVSVDGTRQLDLQIITPTDSSCNDAQTANVVIQAIEGFNCGNEVAFTYNGGTVNYGTILSSTGECWLDRNLGASQVATAYNDSAAYGDLFQWGRGDDGHQVRTSGTTTNLSSIDAPGHSNFIYNMVSPYDWRSPQNNNLWQGVSGINNPCPAGWRLPTSAEWQAEITAGIVNSATAYSILKMPMSGWRNYSDANIYFAGESSEYWSSTASYGIWIDTDYAETSNDNRAWGFPVRCIYD